MRVLGFDPASTGGRVFTCSAVCEGTSRLARQQATTPKQVAVARVRRGRQCVGAIPFFPRLVLNSGVAEVLSQHGRSASQQKCWHHGSGGFDISRKESSWLWNSTAEAWQGEMKVCCTKIELPHPFANRHSSSVTRTCLSVQDSVGNYYDCRLTLQPAVVSLLRI